MGLLNTITSAGSSLYNTVSGGFQQAVSTATSYVSPVASSVQSVVQPVQSAAVRTVQPVVSTVSRAVQPVVSTVTQAVQQAPRVIQQAPQTIQSTIRSATPQSVARTVIMANPVTASVMLGTDTIRRTVQAVPRVIQAAPRVVTPARTVIQTISPVVSPVSAATVLGLSAARVIKPRIDPVVRDVTRTISKPRPDLVMAAGLPVTNVLSGVVAPKIQSPISAGVRTIIQAPAVQRATRTGGLVVQDIFGTRKAGLASQARQYEVDVAAYNLNVAQQQREAGWLASNVTRANEFIGSRKFSQEEADVINATMIAPLKSWETSLKSNPQYGDAALKNQSRQLNQTAANITAAQKELQSTGLYGLLGRFDTFRKDVAAATTQKYLPAAESLTPAFKTVGFLSSPLSGLFGASIETAATAVSRQIVGSVSPSRATPDMMPSMSDWRSEYVKGSYEGIRDDPVLSGAFFAVGAGIGGITRGAVGASRSFLARRGVDTFADLAKSPAGKKVVSTLTKRAPQIIGGIYAADVGIRAGSQPTTTGVARELGRITTTEAGPMILGGAVGYRSPEIARAGLRNIRAMAANEEAVLFRGRKTPSSTKRPAVKQPQPEQITFTERGAIVDYPTGRRTIRLFGEPGPKTQSFMKDFGIGEPGPQRVVGGKVETRVGSPIYKQPKTGVEFVDPAQWTSPRSSTVQKVGDINIAGQKINLGKLPKPDTTIPRERLLPVPVETELVFSGAKPLGKPGKLPARSMAPVYEMRGGVYESRGVKFSTRDNPLYVSVFEEQPGAGRIFRETYMGYDIQKPTGKRPRSILFDDTSGAVGVTDDVRLGIIRVSGVELEPRGTFTYTRKPTKPRELIVDDATTQLLSTEPEGLYIDAAVESVATPLRSAARTVGRAGRKVKTGFMEGLTGPSYPGLSLEGRRESAAISAVGRRTGDLYPRSKPSRQPGASQILDISAKPESKPSSKVDSEFIEFVTGKRPSEIRAEPRTFTQDAGVRATKYPKGLVVPVIGTPLFVDAEKAMREFINTQPRARVDSVLSVGVAANIRDDDDSFVYGYAMDPRKQGSRETPSSVDYDTMVFGTDTPSTRSREDRRYTAAPRIPIGAIGGGVTPVGVNRIVNEMLGTPEIQSPGIDRITIQTPETDVSTITETIIEPPTYRIPRTDLTQITGLQEVTIIPPEFPPVDIFIPPPIVPPFTFPPIGPGGGGGSGNAIPGKGGFVFEETFPLGDFMSDTFGVGGLSLGDAFGLPGKRKSRRRRR